MESINKRRSRLPVRRIIWNKSGNPDTFVSDSLGIRRWQLGNALHKINSRSGLALQDNVIIYDDGRVTDAQGYDVGNIHDEI